MNPKFNLMQRIEHYLKSNHESRYTAKELAEWIMKTYPENCEEKKRNTSANTDDKLYSQLRSEIGAMLGRANNHIKMTAERPRKYYYTDLSDEEEASEADTEKEKIYEHELYDKVIEFLNEEFHLDAKRIDEKCSTNKRGLKGSNKWLFPDIIAIENLSKNWIPEIKECASLYSARSTKLWSCEVKTLINRVNVRENYFQAVSNSSWANLGYLISADIRDDTLKELSMLSALHGIGVILLNKDSPIDSEILFPAIEKVDINWLSFNRLAEASSDTKKIIESLRILYLTGKMIKS